MSLPQTLTVSERSNIPCLDVGIVYIISTTFDNLSLLNKMQGSVLLSLGAYTKADMLKHNIYSGDMMVFFIGPMTQVVLFEEDLFSGKQTIINNTSNHPISKNLGDITFKSLMISEIISESIGEINKFNETNEQEDRIEHFDAVNKCNCAPISWVYMILIIMFVFLLYMYLF